MIPKEEAASGSVTTGLFLRAAQDLYSWTHTHEDLEIIMVETGTVEIHLKNSRHLLTGGSIFIMNSNVSHSVMLSEDESDYRVRINYPAIKENHSVRHPEPYFLFEKENPDYDELANLIKTTCDHFENHPTRSALKGDYYYFIGFMRKTGILEKEATLFPEKINDIIDFINNEYTDKLTIEYIAKKFFMSPTYLCRIFKQATNYTILEYINYVRTKNAERLLFKTDMSVLDISTAVGFSSLSYFNRTFKKQTSMTPSAYRNYIRRSII